MYQMSEPQKIKKNNNLTKKHHFPKEKITFPSGNHIIESCKKKKIEIDIDKNNENKIGHGACAILKEIVKD